MPHRSLSRSRQKHRESDVWQRRFWEHTIRDEHDFERHFDYIHYNPVKHGLVRCPHAWKASSFHFWVKRGVCDQFWGCNCSGRSSPLLDFSELEDTVGE
jgi:putative transposase